MGARTSNGAAFAIAGDHGFTLTELLVALALTGIVACAIYQSMAAQQKIYITQDQVSEMAQNLRGAADVMMRDIRTSGCDPGRTAGAGFDLASSSSLQFKADLNGDGDFVNSSPPPAHDSNEQIRYALTDDTDNNGIADAFPCSLGREVWNGGLQQAAENIEVLNFVYLDENGAVLATPVSSSDRSRIRSIEITLVARTEKRDKDYTNKTVFRNQRGTLIYTAPGDGYRRLSLSFTIYCRNMGL